jgi:D-alanyl-D-alanine carboxypeptidase (penicillin-binding protein 5/6)
MKRILCALAALFLSLAAAAQAVPPPPVAARAFYVVDALSGQVLAAAGEDDRFEPASLTKIMTAYVVFRAIAARETEAGRAVKVSEAAARAPGTRMFVSPQAPVTIEELLRGAVVLSANDAALALAEAVAGSEAKFVERMNAEAARLGLANTRYVNATGAPAAGHHSTARDVALVSLALIRDFPKEYALFAQKEYTYNRMSQASRNRLLWTDPTVDGLAAGFTEAAGYGLAASSLRGERRIVSVVLGTRSDALRSAETQKLLNFGFQAYETRRVYSKGQAIANPEVYKGTRSTVPLGFDRDVWITLPRERFTGLAAVLETRQPFVAPLAAGQKAGIMKLMRDNAAVAEIPVVVLEEVPVAGFLSRGWDTLKLLLRPDK